MELYFNELSIKDKGDISYDALRDIVNIYRELLKYNIRTCRIAEFSKKASAKPIHSSLL